MRKKQFLSEDDKRKFNEKFDSHEFNLKKIENDSINKNKDIYHTYDEAIIEFLPVQQREFAHGEAFIFLCLQLKKFLEHWNVHEHRQSLKLAKENFDIYCEKILERKIREEKNVR